MASVSLRQELVAAQHRVLAGLPMSLCEVLHTFQLAIFGRGPACTPGFLAKSITCSGQIIAIDQSLPNSSRTTPKRRRFLHSIPRLSSISDAWGRLNVVTPFHHLSGDSHLHRSLGAGPITASNNVRFGSLFGLKSSSRTSSEVNSTHMHGTSVPVEEPSTVSIADMRELTCAEKKDRLAAVSSKPIVALIRPR